MRRMGLATTLVRRGKKRLLSNQAALTGLLSGMTCTMMVYESQAYPYPHLSCKNAMRGDWVRIGGDFNVAMTRAREEAKE